MSKSIRVCVAFAIATATVVVLRSCTRGEDSSSSPTSAAQRPALDDRIARGREQLEAARALARAQQPARKVVLPADPPPQGLPAWVRRLPSQPDPGMPTPRGSP